MTKRPSDCDVHENAKKIKRLDDADNHIQSLDDHPLDDHKSNIPSLPWLRRVDPEEVEGLGGYFFFRLGRNQLGARPIVAIDKHWFAGISTWANAITTCPDSSSMGVRPVPPGCSEYCFVVLIGLLAAACGDISFLPTFKHGYAEFQSLFHVAFPGHGVAPTVGTFDNRKVLNFGPVIGYFGLKESTVFQCYVQSLARVQGGRTMDLKALLFCLPPSAFDVVQLLLDATDLLDYLCLHPAMNPDFEAWGQLPRTTMLQLALKIERFRDQLKSVPSVVLFSMQLAPALTQSTIEECQRLVRTPR